MALKELMSKQDENLLIEAEHAWLNKPFEQLVGIFNKGKLPHGLLLVAPYQSGKQRLASSLAKAIVCERSSSSLNQACDSCKACHLFNAVSHPDITVLDCLTDNKGKQKKSIGIDQVRELNQKLVETSQFGGWRIAIILSVEKMTRGAFNALLKTLEEPGEQTLILMLASSLNQIPATIKSRCQIFNIPLSVKLISPWLSESCKIGDEEATNALQANHFAPFAAKDYIENKIGPLHQQLSADLDQVLATQLSANEFLAKYSQFSESLWLLMANYFQKIQLTLLNLRQTQDSGDSVANRVANDQLRYSAIPISLPSQLYSQLLEYNRAQCAGSNLQISLQLEAILIQWFEMGRKIVHNSNR